MKELALQPHLYYLGVTGYVKGPPQRPSLLIYAVGRTANKLTFLRGSTEQKESVSYHPNAFLISVVFGAFF